MIIRLFRSIYEKSRTEIGKEFCLMLLSIPLQITQTQTSSYAVPASPVKDKTLYLKAAEWADGEIVECLSAGNNLLLLDEPIPYSQMANLLFCLF